ncbi:50S ribosomal protein L6 [endosymbiont of Sipalinus gigas]|uniref:50S ribosomal protein L6 n=1 Tax=endosymbiont of Sipalinus gigas TaxID=1972134 RepID=UPI000DC6EAC0|nr:50S ribosomal protein L6 [endosymbiont of Sipalinus gigas]BBA85250.1 50S ribosomal protein L6 [endosymbiont of Sipalinus gigas]
MSRIANRKLIIPNNVLINIEYNKINVLCNENYLFIKYNPIIKINKKDNFIYIDYNKNNKKILSYSGTVNSLIKNMIIGVTIGFRKKLIIKGIGYKFDIKDNLLVLSLGYSHLIKYRLDKKIKVEFHSQSELILYSIDKQLLGKVASEIKYFKIPDPYKGKGIYYHNEKIKLKESNKK